MISTNDKDSTLAGKDSILSATESRPSKERFTRPFTGFNIICMAVCLAMIILGFLLMAGGGSSAQEGFNPEIFSTRRIVIGPTIAFLGFLLMAFAIIVKPEHLRKLRGKKA